LSDLAKIFSEMERHTASATAELLVCNHQ